MSLFDYYHAIPAPAGWSAGNVAFDAFSASTATFQNSSPGTLSHTPVGTPRGVVVMVVGGAFSDDEVTGVTYGGVAMTRIDIAQDTLVEPGIVYGYFLGASIPTGTQTVSVAFDTGGNNALKVIGVTTLTGNHDLEAADFDVVQEDAASPVQVTVSPGGESGIAVAGFYSGRNDDTLTAPIGGTTEDGTFAISANYHGAWGHTTPGTSDATIGWTATATDDAALVGVMVTDPAGY